MPRGSIPSLNIVHCAHKRTNVQQQVTDVRQPTMKHASRPTQRSQRWSATHKHNVVYVEPMPHRQSGRVNEPNGKVNGVQKCYYCHKPGHLRRNCPLKPTIQYCTTCLRPGHASSQCKRQRSPPNQGQFAVPQIERRQPIDMNCNLMTITPAASSSEHATSDDVSEHTVNSVFMLRLENDTLKKLNKSLKEQNDSLMKQNHQLKRDAKTQSSSDTLIQHMGDEEEDVQQLDQSCDQAEQQRREHEAMLAERAHKHRASHHKHRASHKSSHQRSKGSHASDEGHLLDTIKHMYDRLADMTTSNGYRDEGDEES